MRRRPALALLLALVWPAAAGADPIATSAGISLNPIASGIHESYNDTVRLPPIPVPFLVAAAAWDQLELNAFGLPPTIGIPYSDAIQGPTVLRLTVLDGTLRVWDRGRHFAVGAGETVYNQTTHYLYSDDYADDDHGHGERQYSRIVGWHVEAVGRVAVARGAIEADLRYAPGLVGAQNSTYDSGYVPSRFDPERGEQIDASLDDAQPRGRNGTLLFGLRYFNYTISYVDIAGHPLADRNAALLLTAGYLWRWR